MLHMLYQNKDIPIDYLVMVLQSIQQTGLQDDPDTSLQLLQSLVQTNKFDLAAKCLTKKEKALVKEILAELPESPAKEGLATKFRV